MYGLRLSLPLGQQAGDDRESRLTDCFGSCLLCSLFSSFELVSWKQKIRWYQF